MGKKQRIMDTVRLEILNGVYEEGDRMPGVAELCDRFDVSTATAVYAMRALDAEGILEARHGDGYFAIASNAAYSVHDVAVRAAAALRDIRNSLDNVLSQLDRAIAVS